VGLRAAPDGPPGLAADRPGLLLGFSTPTPGKARRASPHARFARPAVGLTAPSTDKACGGEIDFLVLHGIVLMSIAIRRPRPYLLVHSPRTT